MAKAYAKSNKKLEYEGRPPPRCRRGFHPLTNMGRSTVHYADSETNNILKRLHNKLRPAGTPVQRVEYIIELLLLRIFEVKLQQADTLRKIKDAFERLAHILDHPEMKEMGAEVERVLLQPQLVRRSRSDQAVRLFYEFYAQTIVGGKWLCVVVKYGENDAFVVTAYLTDKPKTGEDLWPIK